MDINDLRSLTTVLSLAVFLGIVWWVFGLKSNKQRFEEAANLPFAEDDDLVQHDRASRNAQRKPS